jgi:hypothetical protein
LNILSVYSDQSSWPQPMDRESLMLLKPESLRKDAG